MDLGQAAETSASTVLAAEAELAGPNARLEKRVEHKAGSGAEGAAARATIRRADSPSATSARTLAPSADSVRT